MKSDHTPVLLKEVLNYLNIKNGGKYIDATLGAGGHSKAICAVGGKVLGIDRDPTALEIAKQNLSSCPDSVFVQAKFSQIAQVASEQVFVPADGVLFDLGVSSMQLDTLGRGFSFQRDEPLDMRMNQNEDMVTARELVNALREDQLYELFATTTQRNLARAAARAVVRARSIKNIETTGQLAELIENSVGKKGRRIHPATTVFMALRMIVNNELEGFEKGFEGALKILKPGARLAVISFHSGEDRIAKRLGLSDSRARKLIVLTDKPVVPSEYEIAQNPRARSAKLRVFEKL